MRAITITAALMLAAATPDSAPYEGPCMTNVEPLVSPTGTSQQDSGCPHGMRTMPRMPWTL